MRDNTRNIDVLADPRDIAAPYSYGDDITLTVTYGRVDIGGTPCAQTMVFYKDGRAETRYEAWSDIIAGGHDLPRKTAADDDIGYHNLSASDL